MFKLRLIAATTIAAAATLLSSGAAQAYPDPSITIKIDDAILYGGDSFSYTVTSGHVDCDWTVTYDEGRASGESATQTASGASISGSFDTKVVTKTFKSPLVAVCVYDNTKEPIVAKVETSTTVRPAIYLTQDATSNLQAAILNASASATVTLLPRGASTDDSNTLPDTGGSNLWILVVGGALVLGGAGTVYAARRRQHSPR